MDVSTAIEAATPKTADGRQRKLMEQHRRFIVSMMATFVTSPAEIAKRLNSKTWAAQYGFEPVKISRGRVSQLLLHDVDKTLVIKAQAAYLADFSETPLAHKKHRVLELIELYNGVEDMTLADGETSVSDKVKLDYKLRILDQIRAEIGESVDKLADALRASGGQGNAGGAAVGVVVTQPLLLEVAFIMEAQAKSMEIEVDHEIILTETDEVHDENT